MRKIKRTEALALLNRAVEEKGKDFIYFDQEGALGACAYFHDEEPGCIVGHVLSYVGVKPDDLYLPGEDDFNLGTAFDNPDLHSALRANAKVKFTRKARLALLTAQCEQDRGQTWEHATAMAETWKDWGEE